MKITRSASQRTRRNEPIVEDVKLQTLNKDYLRNNVNWNPSTGGIVIIERYVEFKDGKTHHDYYIHLSLDDLAALISLLGQNADSKNDAKRLHDHLNKDIPALVKLLACATGLIPQSIPNISGMDKPSSL